VQFLALARTLAEVLRLRAVQGPAFTVDLAARYVGGGILAALGAWAAVTFYFFGRYRSATAVVVATIVAMLLYKLVLVRNG
jgi:hypothetical protein